MNYLQNPSDALTALIKGGLYVSCNSVVAREHSARTTGEHQLSELAVVNNPHGAVAFSYPSDNVCTMKQH
jgi:hypothetical protein